MVKTVEADVIAFDDPLEDGVDRSALLGGKGAGLVEMTQELGLPVPPGFVITTRVCRQYLATGWREELKERILAQVERLGERTGRRFGDPQRPLLVSVRSGAPVSMPGMMDTLLNVGMTPAIRERLAEETGSAQFAADTWLRFNRMYAELVLGVDDRAVAEAARSDGSIEGLLAAAERVRALASGHGGVPPEPIEQLRGAVEAVFRSWNSERARVFRERERVPEDLGTAVTVQAMVFGNLSERSGTGVVFTRNPTTGEAEPFGDYLPRAQGEDVVAGSHAVHGLDTLRRSLPAVYDELLDVLRRLERHYRDMCDVEFTVSDGRLYVLQTRVGRRSPLAAVRIAVAMAEDPDFPLSRAEAVARVDQETLHKLAAIGHVDADVAPVARGLAASPGIGVGYLCCDPDRAADLASKGTPVILARQETSPADVHGMIVAAGLVTTLGGVASHAAVVARSWAIPAITSLEESQVLDDRLVAGDVVIREGETVTVDGTHGTLYVGDVRRDGEVDVPEARLLREWAAELGVEPGTMAAAPGEAAIERDVTLFEVARMVQLKGLCSAERLAAAFETGMSRVASLIGENPSLFRETARGYALAPAGRVWVAEQLEAERAAVSAEVVERCYQQFVELNEQFKRLVSEWQVASAGGHSDDDWARLVDSVEALHRDFRPLVDEVAGEVPRLATYGALFDRALEAMHGGDTSMLASPLKDSYHTAWFEFHEELLTVTGRDRAVEESAQ
ncbi:MAG: hypothetical protein Kow0010_19290 [Dehalococcoidia bacterium]